MVSERPIAANARSTRGMLEVVRIYLAWTGGHVSKFARGLSRGLLWVVAFFLSAGTFLTAGQAQTVPRVGARGRIARAADTVLRSGLPAKIPPHVSEMLGIASDGKECLVAQRFERNGKLVRGFNVSLTDKNNIVLFVTDEATNEQTYYLTSGLGGLGRVVAVREGTGHVVPLTGKQRAAFEKELRFWLDRIVPGTTSK